MGIDVNMMSTDSIETDIKWIVRKLQDFDDKLDRLVDKDTCAKSKAQAVKDVEDLRKDLDRRLKDVAPKNEFNIVKSLVFGYTALILAYAVRSWLQTFFVSNAGAGVGL